MENEQEGKEDKPIRLRLIGNGQPYGTDIIDVHTGQSIGEIVNARVEIDTKRGFIPLVFAGVRGEVKVEGPGHVEVICPHCEKVAYVVDGIKPAQEAFDKQTDGIHRAMGLSVPAMAGTVRPKSKPPEQETVPKAKEAQGDEPAALIGWKYPRDGQCRFDRSWSGRCPEKISDPKRHEPFSLDFCAEHQVTRCKECHEKAVTECGAASSLVCGRPLCQKCKCSIHYPFTAQDKT